MSVSFFTGRAGLISWPGLSALVFASVVGLLLSLGTVLAQGDPRALGAVHLSSPAPGVIEASWGAPSETAYDYRISWAPVGEEYRSWRDNNFNGYPSDPAYTIRGLREGVRYKLRLRARYNGSAGPWSGDHEIRVASAPPPPTDTPPPPTDTPPPPTDTPPPPTDTPVPPIGYASAAIGYAGSAVPRTRRCRQATRRCRHRIRQCRRADTPVPPSDTPVPPSLIRRCRHRIRRCRHRIRRFRQV